MTQIDRGFTNNRTYITSLKQKMPQGKLWKSFLGNPENKSELIEMFVRRCLSENIRKQLQFELVITHEKDTFLLTKSGISELPSCNHIETDTTHSRSEKSKIDVVIIYFDTDILVLMCFVYKNVLLKNNWFMMIDNETYVTMKRIREHFGNEVCDVLPAYHSITGCDTTSYPANVGKIDPFNRMILTTSMYMLKDLGRHEESYLDLSKSLNFFHPIMYSGKNDESMTNTRVRTFKNQKKKSGVNIIPDPASIHQHLLRADLQAFIWHQCTSQIMNIPNIDGRGWCKRNDIIVPVWYIGQQLPPSLTRSKPIKKGAKVMNLTLRKEKLVILLGMILFHVLLPHQVIRVFGRYGNQKI